MASIPDIDESRKQFNRAFYGNGTIAEKIEAAYNCSIAYEMRNNPVFGMAFEKIGNYYWLIRKSVNMTVDSKPDIV